MEAQGVEILTCGTCLNFYGLAEKLAVGGVTNMYAIVEAPVSYTHLPAWFGFSIAFLPPPGQGPFQTLPAASSFYPCYTISREKFVGFWLVL